MYDDHVPLGLGRFYFVRWAWFWRKLLGWCQHLDLLLEGRKVLWEGVETVHALWWHFWGQILPDEEASLPKHGRKVVVVDVESGVEQLLLLARAGALQMRRG